MIDFFLSVTQVGAMFLIDSVNGVKSGRRLTTLGPLSWQDGGTV